MNRPALEAEEVGRVQLLLRVCRTLMRLAACRAREEEGEDKDEKKRRTSPSLPLAH